MQYLKRHLMKPLMLKSHQPQLINNVQIWPNSNFPNKTPKVHKCNPLPHVHYAQLTLPNVEIKTYIQRSQNAGFFPNHRNITSIQKH